MSELIRNEAEAIDCLKKNRPSSGFYMLQESVDMAIKALSEVQQLHAIGTVSEFRELKEKATAKRKCHNCNELLSDEYRFCPTCRRKVDWSEGKE